MNYRKMHIATLLLDMQEIIYKYEGFTDFKINQIKFNNFNFKINKLYILSFKF